jgi:hypothetical protein
MTSAAFVTAAVVLLAGLAWLVGRVRRWRRQRVYVGATLITWSGTGEQQTCTVSAYDENTKTATIDGTFEARPDAATTYSVRSDGDD